MVSNLCPNWQILLNAKDPNTESSTSTPSKETGSQCHQNGDTPNTVSQDHAAKPLRDLVQA